MLNEPQPPEPMSTPKPPTGWRIRIGFSLLILSLLGPPVLLGLLAAFGVSGGRLAAIGGTSAIAAELILVLGAAIAGKDGFAYIKSKVFGALKRHLPATVSKPRYRIGLSMFLAPLVFGWAAPYFGDHLPGYESNRTMYAIVGDVILVVSLFVLGGEFWEKLWSLFLYDAKAMIHEENDRFHTAT
jgi:hypothetical protein